MKIHGVTITEAQIEACIARMKAGPFRAWQISGAAQRAGVPAQNTQRFISDRFADRLIQKLRKAGKIKVGPPYPTWTWSGRQH